MSSAPLLRPSLLFTLLSSLALGACNSVTGADGLDFEEGEQLWELVDAGGVSITQVALYQGVKVTLMENGLPATSNVPVVAGRDALMRVWLAADANYNGQPVVVRMYVNGVEEPIETVGPVPLAPNDADLASTLNIQVPGASVVPGFSYRFELLQPRGQSKGENPAARYPAEGFAPTNVVSVGETLKITLVPIRYNGDGSGRLPDTSEAMVQGYKDFFQGMYPAPRVEITLHEVVDYSNDVLPYGQGWDSLLGWLGQLRSKDQAPFDVYYYGIFNPANNWGQFCGGGCVAGLGNIGGPGDAYSRAAIGLGFSDDGGQAAWETAVHEIGHTHGRFHSPCGGAQGTDPDYPYSMAKIGVWGYDIVKQRLWTPESADVMSYCLPIWVSDYTFMGFLERIQQVNASATMNKFVAPELLNRTYDRATIDGEGNLRWLPELTLELPPEANPVTLMVETDADVEDVGGNFYPYDHLPGGVFLWPRSGAEPRSVTVEWKGVARTLSRD